MTTRPTTEKHRPPTEDSAPPGTPARAPHPPPASLEAIRKALERNDGNQSAAARDLGVDRGIVTRAVKDHPELKPRGSPGK